MNLSNSAGVVGAIILGGVVAYGAVLGLIWLDIRQAHRKLERNRARERKAILFGDSALLALADREDRKDREDQR
jgi:hypothetical protein